VVPADWSRQTGAGRRDRQTGAGRQGQAGGTGRLKQADGAGRLEQAGGTGRLEQADVSRQARPASRAGGKNTDDYDRLNTRPG
jgi:hypothetical protein